MKTALIILDGFGVSADEKTNPVFQTQTPFLDFLLSQNPHLLIEASQEGVGLPFGEPGNSEVGHYNLGTGQLSWQSQEMINQKIDSGEFFKNPALLKAVNFVKQNNSRLHLLGLVSNGGVHSHLKHLFALLKLAKEQGLRKNQVFIHGFTDGRDTAPQSAETYFKDLDNEIAKTDIGAVASVCGRYYAMDRDNHWERTLLSYQAIVEGKGEIASNPFEAIRLAYERKETDEFIKPTVIVNQNKQPLALVQENDAVIFFNFRADRARQLTKAFLSSDPSIPSRKTLSSLLFATLTPYETDWKIKVEVAFWPQPPQTTLAQLISQNNLSQLHLAETEKYAHVTYFFNGGQQKPLAKEKQVIVPSPRVPTYDQKPEMSAFEITQKAKEENQSSAYDFIVINYANGDMVGHTGNFQAIIKALQALDQNLKELIPFLFEKKYKIFITADHGNCEQAINPSTGEIDKEHTINPVFLVRIDHIPLKEVAFETTLHQKLWLKLGTENKKGILADVTATLGKSLGLDNSLLSGEPILN